MPVTIKDIAKLLGVSHATVSRVLNNKPGISQETRERILETAKQHGYTPNISARSLISGKSNSIGLYILYDIFRPTFPQDFLLKILAGMVSVLEDTQYNITLLFNVYKKEDPDRFDISRINMQNLVGIFVLTLGNEAPIVQDIVEQGIPVVLVNQHFDGVKASSVLTDDISGAYVATKHLLELGHKRIAHIEGDPQYWTSNQRREGYCKALRDAGIQSEESLIEKGFYDEQLAYKAMTILLKRETFTAVFVANDIMALGVYRAIRERGLKIPSDISVVGFDDTEFARLVDPPLTTVKKPWQEVGREATKAMLSLLESEAGTETTIKKVALMNRLIIRESSGGGRRNHT